MRNWGSKMTSPVSQGYYDQAAINITFLTYEMGGSKKQKRELKWGKQVDRNPGNKHVRRLQSKKVPKL